MSSVKINSDQKDKSGGLRSKPTGFWERVKKTSLFIKILAVVLLVGFGWFLYNRFGKGKTQQPQYQTTQAEKGTLITSVSASGKIGPDLSSQQERTAAWGSYLSAKNNLISAQNTLYSLQSSLFAANQKFINDAVARGLTADDPTYIQENADWLAAEAKYKSQQEIIAQAQVAANAAWLSYQQASPMNIPKGIYALVNLTEADVIKVKIGQKATLTLDALPDKTFTGKVWAVNTNGSTSTSVTTYPAIITFDSPIADIYPQMGVNATIITDIKENVILIPSVAVQITNGQSTVRLLKDGQVTSVTVEVGEANDTQTEITSGISEGETVITGSSTSQTTSSSKAVSPFAGFGGGANRMFR